MFSSLISRPRLLLVAFIAVLGFLPMTTAQAENASIQFEVFRAGFIVGGQGGGGTLIFKGKGYPIRVRGLSLGATIGVARAELVGEVSNINRPEDIEGVYTAVGGAAVLAGGASTVEMVNSNDVRMRLRGRAIGLELSLDLSGMRILLR